MSVPDPSASMLADESFMSADDLRDYMVELEMAKASKMLGAMDRADEARRALVATLSEEIDVSPAKIAEIKQSLATKTRAAAGRGEKEVLVMRFPSALCKDRGRAINNAEADWPSTLTGRPRQAYEFWKEHLQPANYKLRAMVIEWPGGLPGDVAFYLSW
jgi:hypothetical protein